MNKKQILILIQIFSVMEDDKSLSDYGLTSTVAKAQQPAEVMQMTKMLIVTIMIVRMMVMTTMMTLDHDMISMMMFQGWFGISWGGRHFGVGGT